MPYLAQYFIKLSIGLGVVYLFYALVLRRLTFYNWNRWYLLGYSILALLIPFVNISPVLENHDWSNIYMVQIVPVMGAYTARESVGPSAAVIAWSVLAIILGIGIVIMLLRLLIQYTSYRRVKRSAALLSDDTVKVYQVDKDIVPFSFGNSIFINHHRYDETELKEIIRHEFIHVKQRHTIDVLWSELLCVLNWYNPFAWLIRRSIRQNLEFIADHQVLQTGLDRRQYQYMLLKVVGGSAFAIGNQFNFSALKKRIAMMNKIRSARINAVRFLFALPLLVVLLLAFRNVIADNGSDGQTEAVITGLVIDAVSMQPLSGAVISSEKDNLQTLTDEKGYYKIKLSGVTFPVKYAFSVKKENYQSTVAAGTVGGHKNGNTIEVIDFVGLTKSDGSTGNNSFIWSSVKTNLQRETSYEDVVNAFAETQKSIQENNKIQELAMASKKPYWVGAGKSYVFTAAGGYASVDGLTDIVFVDGKQMTGEEVNRTITRDKVVSAEATEAANAVRKYGINKAVLAIYSRNKAIVSDTIPVPGKVVPAQGGKPVVQNITRDSAFFMDASLNGPGAPGKRVGVLNLTSGINTSEPLVFVDGKEIPPGDLQKLDNNNIQTITILKDSLTSTYGERGRNGVILIENKKKAEPTPPAEQWQKLQPVQLKLQAMSSGLQQPGKEVMQFKGTLDLNRTPMLYIVEGKRFENVSINEALGGRDADDIETLDVVKPSEAVEKYGAAGRNGVILISLKKHNKPENRILKADAIYLRGTPTPHK